MSAKSELNIFCQKTKIATPEYNSYKDGGSDHSPLFIGYCIYNGKEYKTDNSYPTKKDADNGVANVIFQSFQENTNNYNDKLILIIDLDNQNQFDKYMPFLELKTNYNIIGYGGPRLKLPEINGKHIDFKKTEITNKDAADIELAFLIGQMENSGKLNKKSKIIIFSTDYALQTISQILNRNGYNTEFICDIVNWLKNN